MPYGYNKVRIKKIYQYGISDILTSCLLESQTILAGGPIYGLIFVAVVRCSVLQGHIVQQQSRKSLAVKGIAFLPTFFSFILPTFFICY